jgi:hypothetical protein
MDMHSEWQRTESMQLIFSTSNPFTLTTDAAELSATA